MKNQIFSCELVNKIMVVLDVGNFDDDCFVENPSTPKDAYNYLCWFYSQVSGGGVTQFYEVTLPARFSYEALFDCVRYIGQDQLHRELRRVHATFPIELREISCETDVPVQRSAWGLGRLPGSEETRRLLDKLDSWAVHILPWLEYQMALLALSDIDAFPKLKRAWEDEMRKINETNKHEISI